MSRWNMTHMRPMWKLAPSRGRRRAEGNADPTARQTPVTRESTAPPGEVFLDTSALFAALDRGAEHHAAVASNLERLMRSATRVITTDVVLTEFHGLVLGRLGPAIAFEAIDRVLASPRIDVLPTGPHAIRLAMDFLGSRPARRLSLVDALFVRDDAVEPDRDGAHPRQRLRRRGLRHRSVSVRRWSAP